MVKKHKSHLLTADEQDCLKLLQNNLTSQLWYYVAKVILCDVTTFQK